MTISFNRYELEAALRLGLDDMSELKAQWAKVKEFALRLRAAAKFAKSNNAVNNTKKERKTWLLNTQS